MMLQGRSGSGDGGELIDRVSLTSSISFIQSQTFPESILSQSFSRYYTVNCGWLFHSSNSTASHQFIFWITAEINPLLNVRDWEQLYIIILHVY